MQKRILYITPVYSGVRKFLLEGEDVDHGMPGVYRLIKQLEFHGWEIHILVQAEAYREVVKVSERIFIYPYRSPRYRWLISGQRLLSDLSRGIRKGYVVARNHQPDVIYAVAGFSAIIGYGLSKLTGVPNITRLFGTTLYGACNGRISAKVILQRWQDFCNFVVPSEYLIITDDGSQADRLARILKVKRDRLKFWMNGVDKNIYNPSFDIHLFRTLVLGVPDCAKILLSVSRLEGWKRVDRLIRVVTPLLANRPDVFLVLLGDGADRNRLQELSRNLEIDSKVIFMGRVPSSEVPNFLNTADVFLALYDYSNLSNTTLEAMTCARCVVVLDVGDTWKIIENGKTGVMVSETELSKLPDLLEALVDNDTKRLELGLNARDSIVHNVDSWDERIEKEISLITSIVKKRKRER